jgi:hypothetical protein
VTKAMLLGVALSLVVPALPDAQTRPPDAQKRRNHIQMMEGVLAKAVQLGAEELGRKMQSLEPGLTVVTGEARARGFILEGYGVFFDVEIPGLRQSVVWSWMTVQRELQVGSALESLRRALALLPDPAARQQAQQDLTRVELQVGPVRQRSQAPPPGEITAADAKITPVPDLGRTQDPNAEYTEAVKSALIDAMLEHSFPMDIAADEWLTVAARDSEGPQIPGEIYDASTIVLRVKGSDLAMYAVDRSKHDEVRKKVEVRVF